MSKYVIYARKSTESEDRQVLSIDSQINELKAVAARFGIEVSCVLQESMSAKAPGRPIFNKLMEDVEAGTHCGHTLLEARPPRPQPGGRRAHYLVHQKQPSPHSHAGTGLLCRGRQYDPHVR